MKDNELFEKQILKLTHYEKQISMLQKYKGIGVLPRFKYKILRNEKIAKDIYVNIAKDIKGKETAFLEFLFKKKFLDEEYKHRILNIFRNSNLKFLDNMISKSPIINNTFCLTNIFCERTNRFDKMDKETETFILKLKNRNNEIRKNNKIKNETMIDQTLKTGIKQKTKKRKLKDITKNKKEIFRKKDNFEPPNKKSKFEISEFS